MCPLLRCWKVLRSWTTVCCSGFTIWTRRRGRGRWRALRAAAMRRGLWPSRRPCTPQPWSQSREEPPAEGPSTLTTREFIQRDKRLLAKELGDKCDCWHLQKGQVHVSDLHFHAISIAVNEVEYKLTIMNFYLLTLIHLVSSITLLLKVQLLSALPLHSFFSSSTFLKIASSDSSC